MLRLPELLVKRNVAGDPVIAALAKDDLQLRLRRVEVVGADHLPLHPDLAAVEPVEAPKSQVLDSAASPLDVKSHLPDAIAAVDQLLGEPGLLRLRSDLVAGVIDPIDGELLRLGDARAGEQGDGGSERQGRKTECLLHEPEC